MESTGRTDHCLAGSLIESELEEDYFLDKKETEATNRTGNYSVLMKLESNIPQLIPMNGRRIKIYHKGIVKLCTKCFGNHRKSDCKQEKKNGMDRLRH